jgi:hypothetical protein
MTELVTIFRSRSPLEVQLIQTALQAAGLDCHVEGEHQAGYSGLFDVALVVRAEDEAAARELLAEFRANAQLEPGEVADDAADDAEAEGGDDAGDD